MPESKSESKSEKTTPKGSLVPAGESSDPAVQWLIAERQSAVSNSDEKAAQDIDKQLAELGYC